MVVGCVLENRQGAVCWQLSAVEQRLREDALGGDGVLVAREDASALPSTRGSHTSGCQPRDRPERGFPLRAPPRAKKTAPGEASIFAFDCAAFCV